MGLSLGSGRSPEEENDNPLHYSFLENPMDRGAWRATVHGVARVAHDLATTPPPLLLETSQSLLSSLKKDTCQCTLRCYR